MLRRRVQLHSSHIHFGFRESAQSIQNRRHTEEAYHRVFAYPFNAWINTKVSFYTESAQRRDQLVFERSKTRFTTSAQKIWSPAGFGAWFLKATLNLHSKSRDAPRALLAAMGDQDPAKKKDAFCPGVFLPSVLSETGCHLATLPLNYFQIANTLKTNFCTINITKNNPLF